MPQYLASTATVRSISRKGSFPGDSVFSFYWISSILGSDTASAIRMLNPGKLLLPNEQAVFFNHRTVQLVFPAVAKNCISAFN